MTSQIFQMYHRDSYAAVFQKNINASINLFIFPLVTRGSVDASVNRSELRVAKQMEQFNNSFQETAEFIRSESEITCVCSKSSSNSLWTEELLPDINCDKAGHD